MDYGKAIRLVRAARGLSQKELAARLDVDGSLVSYLESGERRPSADTQERLARALNMPLYLLILLGSSEDELERGFPTKGVRDFGQAALLALIAQDKPLSTTRKPSARKKRSGRR